MDDIARFLSQHVPFKELPPDRVTAVARRVHIEYFPRGARIVAAGDIPTHMVVVRSGSAEAVAGPLPEDSPQERYGEGDAFDATAVWRQAPATVDIVAREDLLAYLVSRDVLAGLAGLPAMAAFLDGTPGGRLRRAMDDQAEGSFVDVRVGDLANTPPLTCPPQTSVREAARIMAAARMSSILVPGQPWGILTDRDLRTRVLAAGADPSTPVASVATAPMLTISADARVLEALAVVMEQGVHHLPVETNGVPIGVVTVTDLLRLQSRSPLLLGRVLERTRNADDVEGWSRQVGPAFDEMVRSGVSASAIGRLAALAFDALVRRLAVPWIGAEGMPPFTWLALGPSGRRESAWPPDGNSLVLWEGDDAEAGERLTRRVGPEMAILARLFAEQSSVKHPDVACRRWDDIEPPTASAPEFVAAMLDARPVAGGADPAKRLAAFAANARTPEVVSALLARIPRAPASWCAEGVVEPDGTVNDAFDVAARVVVPIEDLARLAALVARAPVRRTPDRLHAAAAAGILEPALGADLASAHEWAAGWVMRRRGDGTASTSGSVTGDRALLRDCFAVVRLGLAALTAAVDRERLWTR